MFVTGATSDEVHQYNLGTGFDITTAAFDVSLDVSSETNGPESVVFNSTGSRMFVAESPKVFQYNLFTNFDISTASLDVSFDVGSQDNRPRGITFNPTGSRMFVVGTQNNNVYQYNLTTNFDVTTATFLQSFGVGSEDNDAKGVRFNPTGSRMFVVGRQNAKVYQYNLGTAFDITTASFSVSFDVSSEDDRPEGITFNDTGSRMFIIGTRNNSVYQYNLGTPFDISTI